jgi:hypothetical protein
MNFYKIITSWNDNEWTIKQRHLDNKLQYLKCYETTTKYLLFIREHGRQQKESLNKSSIIDYPNIIQNMTNDNNNILQDLQENLDSLNPCHSLKEWIDKRLNDVSDV